MAGKDPPRIDPSYYLQRSIQPTSLEDGKPTKSSAPPRVPLDVEATFKGLWLESIFEGSSPDDQVVLSAEN